MSVLFLPPPSASSIPDASETVSGKIRIATSAEATAGTNDLTAMTPAKVKTVVDAAVVGGVQYKGTFDASAPADLSNAEQGDLYIISVAGTYQGQSWAVGDHLLINADMGGTIDPAKIDKVDNTDSVTSVAGRTGAVTLSTADISGLATVASTGAYSDLTGTPSLATVATTGAYSDLTGTPSLATVATTGAYSDLTGTPSLATVATTGAYSDLSGTPTLGTAAALDVGTSATNVVQLDGSARLPAVDGSQLTGITASVAALDDIGDVTITSVQDYAVLKYDSGTTEWIDAPQINYVFTSTTQSLDLKPGLNRVIMAGGASAITLTLGISTLVAGQGAVFTVLSTGTATSTLTIGSTSWNFDQHQGGVFQATGLNTAYMVSTISYDQLQNLPTLGTAAALDVGTSASNVVQLNGSAQLPAVDGSLLTGITASVAALNDIGDVSAAAPSNTNVIKYNSTSGDWESGAVAYAEVTGTPTLATVATTGAYSDLTGTPTLATVATTGAYSDLSGTPTLGTAAALDVGTSASNVVQLDGSARLPAVDGSQLTNLPSGQSFYTTTISSTGTAAQIIDNRRQHYNVISSGITLTIPSAGASAVGGIYSVRNTSGGNVTVNCPPTKINNGTNLTSYTVAPNDSRTFLWLSSSVLTEIAATRLDQLGDVDVTGAANTNVLKYNSTSGKWEDGSVAYSEVSGTPTLATVATTGAYSDLTGTPTLGTAAALDVGTSANNVVQLNGSAQLPAVDGSLLTGITASASPPSVTVSSPAVDQNLTGPSGNEEVYVYTPSAAISVNLVAAATCGSGFKYQIKNRSTNTITIDPNGTETIDGALTYALATQEESVTIITDGSNWFII